MADQLISVVAFTAVAAGGSASLPHLIRAGGVNCIPDLVLLGNGEFAVLATTSTTITVQNNSAASANCSVFVLLAHSLMRGLGASTSIGNFTGGLTPRPFVAAAGGSGGGGSTQHFTYTATGVEGATFTVTLPVAMPSADYVIQATQGEAALSVVITNADGAGDRTVTTFVCDTSLQMTAGDTIDFTVAERT